MRNFLFASILLFAAPCFAQQACVDTTPAQRETIQWLAAQNQKTPQEMVQFIWNDLLERAGIAQKNTQRLEMQKKYEALSPIDKAAVDGILK